MKLTDIFYAIPFLILFVFIGWLFYLFKETLLISMGFLLFLALFFWWVQAAIEYWEKRKQ